MLEFAVTVERGRGLELYILRAADVRDVRQHLPKMFRDDDFVRILTVRRYTERALESQFDPFGVLAREREDQRARHRINSVNSVPSQKMNEVLVLDTLRAKVTSLTANTDGINSGGPAYQHGFAQCRSRVADLIAEQIDLIQKSGS